MASQVTVTGKTGPAVTVTSLILTGLKQFNLDMDRKVLFTNSEVGLREFDVNATTTLTCTITAGANCTMVVSQ